ncbi:MAG: transglutaminaseTgpA domain-containing protein [Verrucomicrobiota bacterium]
MEKRRPQLDSQTLHQVRWLLGGLLALLAAWTVFYMDVNATGLLALTTILVPVVTWRPVLASKLPSWAHMLAFPVIVLLFAADFYQTREPLPVMIRLGLLLLLYRGVTLRTRREDMQLILLCLFLVVVAGVLTVSLVFVLQILLFTACALALLLAITLSNAAAADEAAAGAAKTEGPPAWVRVDWGATLGRLRAVVDWRVLAMGSVLFAGVVGLSALLFLMIPRFELGTNFFLDHMLSGRSKSGFSETVTFGSVVDIQQDRSLALSVDVTDPGQVPAVPYWRMLVLDEYMQGGFMMSPGLSAEIKASEVEATRHRGIAPTNPSAPVWTFYLEGGVSRYLPLVGPYSQITLPSPQTLRINRTQLLVALPKDPSKMTPYRVEGMLPTARIEDADMAARVAAWKASPPEPRRRYERYAMEDESPAPPSYLGLDLPPGELAKLDAWVAEIGRPVDGDHEGFVRRACAWLERRHGYSLNMRLPDAEGDVLVRWMDSPEPGHCELFAGSLVLLSRAAGVPARVAIGFKGGVWNQASGSITVTNADAHAWCEIFDGKRHWVRADPTPGAGGLGPREPAAPQLGPDGAPRLETDSGWAARWNSLRVFWYRRIVSFDQQSQLDMVRSAGRMAESYAKRLISELDRRLKALAEWASTPWSLGRVGWGAGALAAGALLVWGWRKLHFVAWWRALRGADPVRREAGRWLRRLDAKALPADHDVRAELLRLRYGRKATWTPSTRVFKAARAALREWTRRRRG